jgi:hypothetical protein
VLGVIGHGGIAGDVLATERLPRAPSAVVEAPVPQRVVAASDEDIQVLLVIAVIRKPGVAAPGDRRRAGTEDAAEGFPVGPGSPVLVKVAVPERVVVAPGKDVE